jgi:hypothetical protein
MKVKLTKRVVETLAHASRDQIFWGLDLGIDPATGEVRRGIVGKLMNMQRSSKSARVIWPAPTLHRNPWYSDGRAGSSYRPSLAAKSTVTPCVLENLKRN